MDTQSPIVSILIPTVGRKDLSRAIDSLRRQTYQYIQVIIVYDGHPPDLHCISTETLVKGEGSHGPSLRKGLLLCGGDLVAIVDDDTVVPPNWLEKAVLAFSDPRVAFVGGSNLTPPDSAYFACLIGYVQSSYFGSMRMSSRYNIGVRNLDADETEVIATGVYRRKAIIDAYIALGRRVFGSAWENIVLTWMRMQGYLISYDPQLSFYHERRTTASGFFRQVFKSGSGRARYFKVYPRQLIGKGYMLAPSFFVIYIVVSPLLFLVTPVAILPLGIYFIAILGVSLVFSFRTRRIKSALLLPILFLTNHLAYGFGFLYGLVRTVHTWGLR